MNELTKTGTAFVEPEVILDQRYKGQVKTLYISLEAMRGGQIDKATGELTMNRVQKNHLDDDILDDIAGIALPQGVNISWEE
jgi:hypothetical protein